MAIQQPEGTDTQNSPDHSLSHRVFANDDSASAKAVVVDADNNVIVGDGGDTNYAQFDSSGELSFAGTAGIVLPHLMQSDSTDQAISNVNSTQVVTFNTDVHHDGITRTSSSRFTFAKEGAYLIAFSGVCEGATGKEIDVWMRINGDDVEASNTIYTFKTTGVAGVVAVTFVQHFDVDDYFEFWTWGDSTNCKWLATAAGENPTRPACPSIIITANYIGKDI